MKKDISRKQYEPEFKQNAVKLTEKIGVVSTSEKLNIPLSTLQRWKAHKNLPIEKSQDVLKLQNEVKKLKKELIEEKAVVEMLKKATAFFSKENTK